jgi:hypothetical protein
MTLNVLLQLFAACEHFGENILDLTLFAENEHVLEM